LLMLAFKNIEVDKASIQVEIDALTKINAELVKDYHNFKVKVAVDFVVRFDEVCAHAKVIALKVDFTMEMTTIEKILTRRLKTTRSSTSS
jgi:hypothetical protein